MRPLLHMASLSMLLSLPLGISAQEPEEIQLQEAYRFPPFNEADPSYYFAHISDIELLDGGLFAIADQFQYCVWIVREDGTLVEKIGRRGQGPGEFERPWAVEWDAQSEILWVMDMGRIQAFTGTDWSYLHMVRPTEVNPQQMVAVGEKLLFTSLSQGRNDLAYVYDHEGNALPPIGNHLEREVAGYGIRLYKNGSIDATLDASDEPVICYVYRTFNDVLLLTGGTQVTIHIDDKTIQDVDRVNRRLARDWIDPDLGPTPSPLYRDVRITADRMFIYEIQHPGNRILEVDFNGTVRRIWMLPELDHGPLTFTIQTTDDIPIIWAAWSYPDPHIKKLVPVKQRH
ncbi:6-bladed beta-propeller [Gemmatimonadota bacterium]